MKHLIILCGASGTGKTTIQQYLKDKYQMPRVITHTTRKKRDNEIDGVDYYFETDKSFDQKHYFESVNYDGKKYGSSQEALQEAWKKSDFATLVVDTPGAISYVKALGNQVTVFHIQVSDLKELKKRLIKRGDNAELVKQRLASKESQRDLNVPIEIKQNTIIIHNDDWNLTKKKIDQAVQKIQQKFQ
ncbi:guanylate kinase [Ligilactobacillus cholophilus]|uniref:guanylate kinase n=1 Tax=Ligilactobacillus cholophilus TaxID=3050131 RepID=UPI0025AF0FEB|nr:AAA family ATPase [Ligilactobacillus cholophilus]